MHHQEHRVMPFETSTLTGETILVIAPHPDDEVIGCGGVIAIAASEGRPVRVVIATDGAASVAPEQAATLREEESIRGLERLGIKEPPEFLGLPDRSLSTRLEELREKLDEKLRSTRPDLILLPSPLDIHPDHHSVARAVWECFQESPELANLLGSATVAFYETSQALSPDTLVDISSVAETKFAAIREHRSQLSVRDYEWFARGLAQYRALTLPPETRFAEAFRIFTPRNLATTAWSQLLESLRPGSGLVAETTAEPVTVLVRTRNRLALLAEALDSIDRVRRDTPNVQVVVVNDAGESPSEIIGDRKDVRLLDLPRRAGRAEAMNEAARAAGTPFLCFLDDDDLYFPEHVQTLRKAWSDDAIAVYSDAITSFWEREGDTWSHRDGIRMFSRDWDPRLLVFDNYIPLPTLMLARDTWLELGGFDSAFDLFEDWDFLVRLGKKGPLRHVARVTCEVRVFEGGDAITVTIPETSEKFAEAKMAIWEKHDDLATWRTLVDWQAFMKGTIVELGSQLAETRGDRHRLQTDIRRSEREKSEEHERASATAHELGGRINQLQEELQRAGKNYERLASRIGELETEIRFRDTTLDEREQLLETHFREIARLSEILDQIYASKTWKLHTVLERLKGIR